MIAENLKQVLSELPEKVRLVARIRNYYLLYWNRE